MLLPNSGYLSPESCVSFNSKSESLYALSFFNASSRNDFFFDNKNNFGFDILYLLRYPFNINGYWILSISILSFIISSEVASSIFKLNPNPNFILFLIQNSYFALSRNFLVVFSLILRDLVPPLSLGLFNFLTFSCSFQMFPCQLDSSSFA